MSSDDRTAIEKWYDNTPGVDQGEQAVVVGQGEEGESVETLEVDASPDSPADLAPDETNAVPDPDSDFDPDFQGGSVDDGSLEVDEDAIDRIQAVNTGPAPDRSNPTQKEKNTSPDETRERKKKQREKAKRKRKRRKRERKKKQRKKNQRQKQQPDSPEAGPDNQPTPNAQDGKSDQDLLDMGDLGGNQIVIGAIVILAILLGGR